MVLDSFVGDQIRDFCTQLADRGMVDSPDGLYATHMRNLGSSAELNDRQLSEVYARASGQVALTGHLLAEHTEQTIQRAILTAFSIGNPNQTLMLEEVETLFAPEDPRLQLTSTANNVVFLLKPHIVSMQAASETALAQ